MLFIEASAQILNLSFFVIPNVYVLVRPCGWRDDIVLWSAFVSWTCWNTLFLLSVVRIGFRCAYVMCECLNVDAHVCALPVPCLTPSNSTLFLSCVGILSQDDQFQCLPFAYCKSCCKECGWTQGHLPQAPHLKSPDLKTTDSFCLFCTQVRAHNLNLWLDKEGTPKGERSDATVVDAPWWVHAPKLILWAGAEAFKATSVYLVLQR